MFRIISDLFYKGKHKPRIFRNFPFSFFIIRQKDLNLACMFHLHFRTIFFIAILNYFSLFLNLYHLPMTQKE